MTKLHDDYVIPLKVVTARLGHLKYSFRGIMAEIEERALKNLLIRKNNKSNDDFGLLLSWDDWIYAALDIQHREKTNNNELGQRSTLDTILDQDNARINLYSNVLETFKQKRGIAEKKSGWADGLKTGEHIPVEFINDLPMPIGELVALGSWMLTKNVYRFDDLVIAELLKSEFEGKLPNHIINLPDIATYIQTDNADLRFQGHRVVGVIFLVSSLSDQRVLITNLYLDTGIAKTIVIAFDEDRDIEESLTDFVDNFQHEYNPDEHEEELNERLSVLKKLVNLALWFSQEKPETYPLILGVKNEPVGFKTVKGKKRLFEADKYKPFRVGTETGQAFRKIYSELELKKEQNKQSGLRAPHLRRSHWHLYWYGKKGSFERWELKLLPITIVGGS